MTATRTNASRIFTIPELQNFLAWDVQATECHIYPYGYDDGETSEDPIACLHGVEETIQWIKENPAYPTWGEMTGYLVVVFNRAGYSCEVIF